MNGELKTKAFSGMIWMFLERIGAQGVSFIVSIVLARILLPADYGVVAFAQIFITLANVFALNGLNSSLIQKRNPTETDYSTAFYVNLVFSLILYALIYVMAPIIATYFEYDGFVQVLRVLALRLPIGAINAIQRAYVSKNLLFKKFFFSTLFGIFSSGVIGIIMASMGLGVWALVGQYLSNVLFDTFVLFFTVPWKPKRLFSFKCLRDMFGFGFRVFMATFLNSLYIQIRSLIIGAKYSSQDLAYYNRGDSFPQIFYNNIVSSITSVMFPVMSEQNGDIHALRISTKKTIKVCSYVIFPLMIGIALLSQPLVSLLLTEKWEPAIIYIQLSCISYAILPIQSIIEQLYKAIGRSELLIKTFLVEKAIGVILIICSMRISVLAIAVSMLVTSAVATIIHVIPLNAIMGYKLRDLVFDHLQTIFLCIGMSLVVIAIGFIDIPLLISFILRIISGVIVYVILSLMIKSDSLKIIVSIISNKVDLKILRKIESLI